MPAEGTFGRVKGAADDHQTPAFPPLRAGIAAEPLDRSLIEIAQLLAYRLRGELQIFHAVEFLPEPIFRLFQPGSDYDAYKEQVREEHEYLLRDLSRFYGSVYERYRTQVPMLVPLPGRDFQTD